jgi:hypothetical protein
VPTKSTKVRKQLDWADHISAFNAAGMTRAAYCREHDINYDQFGYYLRKADSSKTELAKPKPCSNDIKAIGDFLPVQITSVASSAVEFTLSQPDGAQLHWSAHWSPVQVIEFLNHWRNSQ